MALAALRPAAAASDPGAAGLQSVLLLAVAIGATIAAILIGRFLLRRRRTGRDPQP